VTEKSMGVYNRIAAGGNFAELAREFSQGAGQADGGDIGWVKRGTLVPGIEQVAFEKLSVGQVSTPFRTRMGMHIVKLEARENGAVLPLSTVAPKIREELQSKALEERFVRWLKTDLRKKHRVDIRLAGVVFKPEDSKEGMVDSLMAKSTRSKKQESRTFLSYLNPLSYIVKQTPMDEDDPKSPMAGKSVVNVFGVPLFTSDTVDEDIPDVLSTPANKSGGAESSPEQRGGFLDKLNPFNR
jgi:hypothetical protein